MAYMTEEMMLEEIERLQRALRCAAECWVSRHRTTEDRSLDEYYIKIFMEEMLEEK